MASVFAPFFPRALLPIGFFLTIAGDLFFGATFATRFGVAFLGDADLDLFGELER